MKIFVKTDYGLIPFGKFKGTFWKDVPKDYLQFIITDDCYTNEDNKATAKKELAQRDVLNGQIEMF